MRLQTQSNRQIQTDDLLFVGLKLAVNRTSQDKTEQKQHIMTMRADDIERIMKACIYKKGGFDQYQIENNLGITKVSHPKVNILMDVTKGLSTIIMNYSKNPFVRKQLEVFNIYSMSQLTTFYREYAQMYMKHGNNGSVNDSRDKDENITLRMANDVINAYMNDGTVLSFDELYKKYRNEHKEAIVKYKTSFYLIVVLSALDSNKHRQVCKIYGIN